MHFYHLSVDDDGESRWRDVSIALQEKEFALPAKNIGLSDPEPAVAFVYLSLEPGWNEPIHPSPKRQVLFCMAGEVEVTTSDGDVRLIGAGDVWRMEDTYGKGHHTRVISPHPFHAAVIQLE